MQCIGTVKIYRTLQTPPTFSSFYILSCLYIENPSFPYKTIKRRTLTSTIMYTVKKVSGFWPGIIKLFPARESFVSDIQTEDGKTANDGVLILNIHLIYPSPVCPLAPAPLAAVWCMLRGAVSTGGALLALHHVLHRPQHHQQQHHKASHHCTCTGAHTVKKG